MALGRFLLKRGIKACWSCGGRDRGVPAAVHHPGNPVTFVAPLDASAELRAQIAADLGLDQPLYIQYVDYIGGLLQGDMGYSYLRGTEASTIVFARVPATVELAVAATIVAIVIAIPLGVISATRRREPADYGATLFSLVGISTPNFWLGIMLILVLSVQFDLFPTSRRPIGFFETFTFLVTVENGLSVPMNVGAFLDGLRTWLWHITLPAVTLGTYFTALVTRLTRAG